MEDPPVHDSSPVPMPEPDSVSDGGAPLHPVPRDTSRISWGVIAVSILLIVGFPLVIGGENGESDKDAATGAAARAGLVDYEVAAKQIVAVAKVDPVKATEALGEIRESAEGLHPVAAVAMVYRFLDTEGQGEEKALEVLDSLPEEAPQATGEAEGKSEDQAALLALARKGIEDPAGLSEEERTKLEASFGWFAELLEVSALPEDDPERQALVAKALLVTVVSNLGILTVITAGLAGVGLLIFVLLRVREGRFHFRFSAPSPAFAPVYLEAFAVYLLAMALLDIVMTVLPLAGIPLPFGLYVFSLFMPFLLALNWPLLRGVPKAEARAQMGWTRGKGVWREIAAGLTGYVAMVPIILTGLAVTLLLMGAVSSLTGGKDTSPVMHPIVEGLAEGNLGVSLFLFVLAAGMAPVFEETVFRGAFFASLRGRMSLVSAGLLSCFIFAVVHPQGVYAIPALSAIGFGFACIREWRHSLIASMTAHSLNNALLVVGLILVFG